MKFLLAVVLSLAAAEPNFAAPLQLKNRLVFTRGALSSRDETVWTMNAGGGDQKRVWRVPKGYGRFGGFSRDGKMALSFNNFNLYLHDLRTKHMKRILGWNGGFGSYVGPASFSPDGKQILREIGDGSANSSDKRVLRFPTGKLCLSFDEILSATIHPAGENVPTLNTWSEPRWSADGKQIVAVGRLSYLLAGLPYAAEAQSEIWIMNADGTQAQQITKNPAWDLSPILNFDSHEVAFIRRLDTVGGDNSFYSYNLWISDMSGQSETALTSLPKTFSEMQEKDVYVRVFNPLFSPDGNQVAFEQTSLSLSGNGPRVKQGIYRIDADGTNEKRLADGHLIQWIY